MLLYCYSSLRQAFSNNGTHCTSTSSSGTIGNHILFWISHSMHVLLWFEGLILTVWLFVRTLWFNCWFNKPLTKITGQKFAAVKLIRCWKLKQTNKKKKAVLLHSTNATSSMAPHLSVQSVLSNPDNPSLWVDHEHATTVGWFINAVEDFTAKCIFFIGICGYHLHDKRT